MKGPPTLRHQVEFQGFRLLSMGARILPERVALGLGAALGTVAGRVLRIRRRDVDANLARAFPDRSAGWRSRVALGCYRHVGREGVALLRMAGMDTEDVLSRTTLQGADVLDAALARGKGVILVAGHLGNWEIAGASLTARGYPVDAVAQVQHNPLFNEALVGTRERLGMRVLPRGDAVKRGFRSLRDGRILGLVADQNVRTGGVFVDFFGVPASTARGPGLFAVRTDAPVVALVTRSEPGPRSRYHVEIIHVPVPDLPDPDERVRAVAEACTRILERYIEAAPEQYFWFHKRWKTRPPQEPSPPGNV